MNNPFSLLFGAKPLELVSRTMQREEVIEAFSAEPTYQNVSMITGIRGSGKTVLMTDICNELKTRDHWIVISVNPEDDILHSIAAELSYTRKYRELFQDAKISISLPGINFEIDGEPPITDTRTAVKRMLQSIKKKGDRVLFAIDEVTSNSYVKKFVAEFQIMTREELPVFLLMTGLYENINSLQNEKSLTFLYRAPKILITPLNIRAMAVRYQNVFRFEDDEISFKMARETKGYAFAFQVLGFLTFRNPEHDYKKVYDEYRQLLEEYVYDKLWSEMIAKERLIVSAMTETDEVSKIQSLAKMGNSAFSPYRRRLIKKGIVSGEEYGKLSFTLPLFREYVRDLYRGL